MLKPNMRRAIVIAIAVGAPLLVYASGAPVIALFTAVGVGIGLFLGWKRI